MTIEQFTDAWTDERIDYARERRLWKAAQGNEWQVAASAYKCPNRTERLKLAGCLECSEDTVDNLRYAYRLFVMLMKHSKSSEPIRNLRRRFPYTRWMTIYKMWMHHEFSMDEARDWLENFDGGNDAMSEEIENKHGAPEWERRANRLRREAFKLKDDLGTPAPLQRAARYFVKVFDAVMEKAAA